LTGKRRCHFEALDASGACDAVVARNAFDADDASRLRTRAA
jgi:hypothetical protein